MARVPKSFIEQVLARVDLVDVVSTRVLLKDKGKNLQACCPFHDEKTPSFTVSRDKQFYHCFGCGAHGDAIGFLMQHDNLSFMEALEDLAQKAGVDLPKSNHKQVEHSDNLLDYVQQATQLFQQQLHKNIEVQTYLQARNVSLEMQQRFGIGYAPKSWDFLSRHLATTGQKCAELKQVDLLSSSDAGRYYDRFRHRLMFPIYDRRGRPIGFGGRVLDDTDKPKYLNSAENAHFPQKPRTLRLVPMLATELQTRVFAGYRRLYGRHCHPSSRYCKGSGCHGYGSV